MARRRPRQGAELTWIDGIVDELSDGSLRWTQDDFSSAADAYQLDDAQT